MATAEPLPTMSAIARMGVVSVFGYELDGHIVIEALLLITIAYLLLQKSYTPERPLTVTDIDQLCEEWTPGPLHPPVTEAEQWTPPVVSSASKRKAIANGKPALNFSSTDFLTLCEDKLVIHAAEAAIEKYGCGSCGPRGFYGTIDVHLDLEAKLAQFMGTEEAIIYSFGIATPGSLIPAFCKKGDILIVDEAVNYGIQSGLTLCKSHVRWFKHNDMMDLRKHLERVKAEDGKHKNPKNRRFIIVEGIYMNRGDIAPLPELVALKEEFKFRLLVDESYSIGVLGKTGRGLTEHFGMPASSAEIITASMANALSSMGGFVAGSSKVADHQRLSGGGYVFSASLPPYLAAASMVALEAIDSGPERLVLLRENAHKAHEALRGLPGFSVGGDEISPLIHLYLDPRAAAAAVSAAELSSSASIAGGNGGGANLVSSNSWGWGKIGGVWGASGSKGHNPNIQAELTALQRICERALSRGGILLAVCRYSPLEKFQQRPSLRVCITAAHTEADIKQLVSSLKDASTAITTPAGSPQRQARVSLSPSRLSLSPTRFFS